MQKPHYPHPILAREGWPHIAIALTLALVATLLFGAWSLIFWLAAVFVVQFFRDPPRHVPQQANAVLSPADGRIVVVEKARDPYADRDALKISVFMNVFNVHSNRSPVDGRIRHAEYFPGKFVNADLDKASLENERNALVVETDQGVTVTFVQVAGLVARRILCYVKPGERLARGQRYGFIRFGSRVDVYLPLDAQPRVVIGDKVSATSTILADLARVGAALAAPSAAAAATPAPSVVTGAVPVSAAVAELVPGAVAAAADPAPAAPARNDATDAAPPAQER
ncbi:phosphatidylserine decarboxylase [Achromobacter sp. GG226]|nr:phosphatidylserine decarboxylase [Verticiella sp. GG226]